VGACEKHSPMVTNSLKGGQGRYSRMESRLWTARAQKGVRWDEWDDIMQWLSDWTRLYANSVYLLYMRWHGSPVSAYAGERPVCCIFEQVIFSGVSRDKEASLLSARPLWGTIATSLRLALWWPTIIIIPLVLPVVFIALTILRSKPLVKEVRIRGKWTHIS
jgi:hypothetical protein